MQRQTEVDDALTSRYTREEAKKLLAKLTNDERLAISYIKGTFYVQEPMRVGALRGKMVGGHSLSEGQFASAIRSLEEKHIIPKLDLNYDMVIRLTRSGLELTYAMVDLKKERR